MGDKTKRGVSEDVRIKGTRLKIKATYWDDGTLAFESGHPFNSSLAFSFTLDASSARTLAMLLAEAHHHGDALHSDCDFCQSAAETMLGADA